MDKPPPPIEELWKEIGFKPNKDQKEAIEHISGPLFLAAGPGSGKTRVLLWRTVNLIAYHDIAPEEIFLATFTEKAAAQLKAGLLSYLAMVTNRTGKAYDISSMSIGTVHSICQKMLTDRHFPWNSRRPHPPALMDELGQYFFVYRRAFWDSLCLEAGFADGDEGIREVNRFFNTMYTDKEDGGKKPSSNRHKAAVALIALFNRFSEEYLDPAVVKPDSEILSKLLKMYRAYTEKLDAENRVDFSLIQKKAYDHIVQFKKCGSYYKHIIIDEYQDTNTIQEKLFFALAAGNKNICVVGDDDQALYRFRGATVENLVQFDKRCEKILKVKPLRRNLSTNYRSRFQIVNSYTSYMDLIDWRNEEGVSCRVENKNIKAASSDVRPSVVVSQGGKPETIYRDIAEFIYRLKQEGKISDYSQCAFLFPAIRGWNGEQNARVKGFKDAFEKFNEENNLTGTDDEIKIYAPRAGRFLELDETKAVWGMLLLVFDRPHFGEQISGDWMRFRTWLENCKKYANELCSKDKQLAEFIGERRAEAETANKDYKLLNAAAAQNNWQGDAAYDKSMSRILANTACLSPKAKRSITNHFFNQIVEARKNEGRPFTVGYIVNRASSLDWSVLDFFYQLTGFAHFKKMIDLAENHGDEGPVCNLALIADYLSKFMEQYGPIISAGFLKDSRFSQALYSSFTYALWRLAETEYEDKDDPFPRGRISFLTIHQSKGLEFPVVVLGNLYRQEGDPDIKEVTVRKLLKKEQEGEPLPLISKFDNMRMFYVALSRAENLLVLPRYAGSGQRISEEFKMLFEKFAYKEIGDFDFNDLDGARLKPKDTAEIYSYTSDYMLYKRCPRQYMFLRKYEFSGSRTQMMMFGSLVHQTIEDLHHLLIEEREKEPLL